MYRVRTELYPPSSSRVFSPALLILHLHCLALRSGRRALVGVHGYARERSPRRKGKTAVLKKPPVLAGSRLSTIGAARRGSRKSPASRFSTLIAVVILFASIVAKDASAVPITYTEVFGSFGVCLGSGALICAVGPSGSLGGIAFSNAIVTLTFQGDTANVVPFSVFAPNGIGASGYVNLQGTASVQVTDPTTGAVLAQGTFLPSAGIYFGVDNTNNGVSFGSSAVPVSSPAFPSQPLYPGGMFSDKNSNGLCFGYGTAGTDPSIGSGLAYLPCLFTYDLKSNFTSGLMFEDSCFNFPTSCDAPPPLATTGGDFFITPFVRTGLELGIVGTFTAVTQPMVAFSSFRAEAEFGRGGQSLEMRGVFDLGSSSNGIDPLAEAVTLQIGTFSANLPAGSFRQIYPGQYVFQGISNGVAMQLRIGALSATRYTFALNAKGANLAGQPTPLSVTLTIGDDSGTTTARMD